MLNAVTTVLQASFVIVGYVYCISIIIILSCDPHFLGTTANYSCAYGNIKLVGDGEYAGKVKICINHVWASVCSNDWDKMDATVACRQLGFSQPGETKTLCLS